MAKAGSANKSGAAKIGRPTSYRPELCDEIIEFFDPSKAFHANGKPKLPLLSGFAAHVGVTRNTLLQWCEAHPEFLSAYSRAKEWQEQILVENTLSGEFNASFAGLTAKNILGWRDRQDVEHSGKDGKPIEIHATAADERL